MKNFLAILGTSIAVIGCAQATDNVQRVVGSGATFPDPIYQAWFKQVAEDQNIQVNYQAVGSGSGVRQFIAGTTDFGASDKAVPDKKQKKPMVQIPMVGGAIVPAYNKPGCQLKLTQVQLADIFLGKIKDWKELGCSGGIIKVVHRSDGSGTTAGFTASLSAFSPEWKTEVGTGKAVKWPVGVGAKGNSGVAGVIKNQVGSIGYLNYGYVMADDDLQQPWLENRHGNYVLAHRKTSSNGLSKIKLDKQLRGADPNPVGATSYPIVSLTWMIAHPEHPKNQTLKKVFSYMLSEQAQQQADELGYVPLPQNIRKQAQQAVNKLEF